MSEISIQQYIADHGAKLSWDKAVELILPAVDAAIVAHDPALFQKNIRLDAIWISPETGQVHFQGEKVPLDSFDAAACSEPAYIPWELCNPWSRRGSAAEVYCFAACLYAAICGILPPKAALRSEGEPLLTPTVLGESVPGPVEDVVLKGLALNAADRYDTLEEFKSALVAASKQERSISPAAGFSDAPASSPDSLDLRQIKTVPVTKSLEAPAVSPAAQKKDTSKPIPAFVPVAAIAGAFCLGLISYQLTSARPSSLAAAPAASASSVSSSAASSDFETPPESSDVDSLETQTIQYEDGSVYEGGWRDGARNGHGTLTLANGEVYEGNWAADLLQGTAHVDYVLDAAQGWTAAFDGEFDASQMNGPGTYHSVAGNAQSGTWSVTEQQAVSFAAPNTTRTISASYEGMLNDAAPGGYGKVVWTIDASHTASYVGEWENGVPTGKGTYTATGGESLTGDWGYVTGQKIVSASGASGSYTGLTLNGKPSGLGIAVWSSGDVSITEYKNSVRSGYGISYGKNGDQYTGLWASDIMSNGTGSYTYSDGSRFVGTWSGSQRTGTLTTSSGETYKGTWKNDVLTGKGTYSSPRGDSYDGNWSNGKKSGTGTYRWANGDVYTGSWNNDLPHGSGSMRYANGDSYSGTWTNGSHSDSGTYKWASGDSFEGTLVDGRKEGTGTYTWANGDTYTGSWSNDLQNGKGTLKYATGDSYTGDWADGQKSGTGTYKWSNGDSYAGAWSADLKNGAGVYTWANGTTYKGTWLNGTAAKGGTYTYTDDGVSELFVSGSLVMCP